MVPGVARREAEVEVDEEATENHQYGSVHRVGRGRLGESHHRGEDDHEDPKLRLVGEAVREHNDPDERGEEDARGALEATGVEVTRRARARLVLVRPKVDPNRLGEAVTNTSDEDEDHHELGLKGLERLGVEEVEADDDEQAGENVATNDPLQAVRTILGTVKGVEHHHKRGADDLHLPHRLDEDEEAEEGEDVTPREVQNRATRHRVLSLHVHQQRHRVRSKVLEFAGVVHLEPRRLRGEDVAVLVDLTEPAAHRASNEGDAAHDRELHEVTKPKHGVGEERRRRDKRPRRHRAEQHAPYDEESEVKGLRPGWWRRGGEWRRGRE